MIEFKLPSLGADMDQGKLLEWKVRPGDRVKRGQVVAIVDTSKAAVDVEIWQDGTIAELLVQPGETIPVDTPLAMLLAPGESAATAPQPMSSPVAPVQPRPAASMSPLPPDRQAPVQPQARRRISPAARKRAEERGIDIDAVVGSGPDGAVTLDDVERAGSAPAAPAAPAAAAAASKQAEMRRAIAAAMSRSKREIPHYYLAEPVCMRLAADWLAAANAGRGIGDRLLMAVLQLKAVALALRKFPDLNGFYRDGAHQPSAAAHIGVAISLRQGGLIAPAIHDVGDKSLAQLMQDLTDLVARARAGSLRSSEMSDPTITVTNLGDQGVEAVHGVIYPPQVALVGFGRMGERPWVEAGKLCVQPLVTASLAADHRVSDGHRGALFLAEIRELLQRPAEL
jgi:pyruvate dehydrogenase E2 component (dihydrolipoamide acetyltransferase)